MDFSRVSKRIYPVGRRSGEAEASFYPLETQKSIFAENSTEKYQTSKFRAGP